MDQNGPVAVRTDCRHFSSRTTPAGDVVPRCRLGANEEVPFACPDGCLFFEPRHVSDAGWTRDPTDGPQGPPTRT